MRVLIFLLLSPIVVFSQLKIEGKVIDAVTKQPIPYVNLEFSTINERFQANELGIYKIHSTKISLTDSVRITRLGYNSIYDLCKKVSSQEILEMQPKAFLLNEVKIGNHNKQELEIGVTSKSGHKWESYYKQVPDLERAVYLNYNEKEITHLKSIHVFMGDEKIDAPFSINFCTNKKGMLGKTLLESDLKLIAYKKNAWNTFDLVKYGLIIPKEGVWIVVKWLKDENHKLKKTIKTKYPDGTIKNRDVYYYGPEIIERFGTKHGLTFIKDRFGWRQARGTSKGVVGSWKGVNADLMIKATIEIIE